MFLQGCCSSFALSHWMCKLILYKATLKIICLYFDCSLPQWCVRTHCRYVLTVTETRKVRRRTDTAAIAWPGTAAIGTDVTTASNSASATTEQVTMTTRTIAHGGSANKCDLLGWWRLRLPHADDGAFIQSHDFHWKLLASKYKTMPYDYPGWQLCTTVHIWPLCFAYTDIVRMMRCL